MITTLKDTWKPVYAGGHSENNREALQSGTACNISTRTYMVDSAWMEALWTGRLQPQTTESHKTRGAHKTDFQDRLSAEGTKKVTKVPLKCARMQTVGKESPQNQSHNTSSNQSNLHSLQHLPRTADLFCSRRYVASWRASVLRSPHFIAHGKTKCKSHRGSAEGGKSHSCGQQLGLRAEAPIQNCELNPNVVDMLYPT